VLLHHAGGSAGGFLPLAPFLPSGWRLLAVDLPGRLYEPAGRACRTITEAVDYLVSALRRELSGPYAVFGHSMGALLAYELVRHLEQRGRGPDWLGASGLPAPQIVGRTRLSPPPPPVPAADERVAARATRTLRDDLALVDGYRHFPGTPLRTALSVFRGDADPLTPPEFTAPWSELADGAVNFHSCAGGHFFPFERPEAFSDRLAGLSREGPLAYADGRS